MREEHNKENSLSKVICFGEVLWDLFPQGAMPGGAPMNVAYHLSQAGIAASMISKVGDDNLGTALLQQLKTWNIATEHCKIDRQRPTGTVVATLDEKNEAHYQIVEEVAWDYIQVPVPADVISPSCKAFVYGSLAARNEVSKQTLFDLLPHATYKVFDVNLRAPFYTYSLLEKLLHTADLVKVSEGELELIVNLAGKSFVSEEQRVAFIQDTFKVQEVVLTKGSNGARYYADKLFYELPIVPVQVQDTVGSGDSFLAGFLAEKIRKSTPEEAMVHAVTLSAFVTSRSGACPPYTQSEFEKFKEKSRGALLSKMITGKRVED